MTKDRRCQRSGWTSALRIAKRNLVVLTGSAAIIVSSSLSHGAIRCVDAFQQGKSSSAGASTVEGVPDSEVAKMRDRGQRLWTSLHQQVLARLQGKTNPLIENQFDANAIGQIHAHFSTVLPGYFNYHEVTKQTEITIKQYYQLRQEARTIISDLLKKKPAADDMTLFAALEIISVMHRIHSRIDFPHQTNEEKKKAEEEAKKKEEEEKAKKQQEEEDNDVDLDDDYPDTYRPDNKDLSTSGDQRKKERVLIATSELPSDRFMRAVIYDVITPDGQFARAPLNRPVYAKEAPGPPIGSTKLTVGKNKRRIIYVQEGLIPVAGKYQGFTVSEIYPGEFAADVTDHSLKEIDVPLRRAPRLVFPSGRSAKAYTEAAKIKTHLWPKELLNYMAFLKARNLSEEETAIEVTKYLSQIGDYIYYSKGNLVSDEKFQQMEVELARLREIYHHDALAFSHLKSFNCDGAAMIGTLLLQNFFKIAARPVVGRTLSKKTMMRNAKGEKVWYYVSTADAPRHALVEAWINGKWMTFDMTPKKNTPHGGSSDSDLETIETERKPEIDDRAQSASNGGAKDDAKHDQTSTKNGDTGKKAEKTDSSSKQDESKGKQNASEKRDIIDQLKTRAGDSQLYGRTSQSPEAALYHALGEYLNHHLLIDMDRKSVVETALKMQTGARGTQILAEPVAKAYRQARKLYYDHLANLPQKSLTDLFTNIQLRLIRGELTSVYADLRSIKLAIEQLREHRDLSSQEAEFVDEIERFLQMMKKHQHADSKEFEIVQRLLNALPGPASREWLRRKYGDGIFTIGHPDVKALAKDILQDKLRPLVLAAVLRDYAKLALNSEQVPAKVERSTLDRAETQTNTSSVVLARSATELPFFIWNLKGGEHVLAPLVEGRQWMAGEAAVEIERGNRDPVERKTTYLYTDISESMEHDQAEKMQAADALQIAIVDMAMSETDVFNDPIHDLSIVYFNTELSEAKKIANLEQAIEFIGEKIALRTSAKGDTSITAPMLHFWDLIHAAHNASLVSKQFASLIRRANFALLSDGEDKNLDIQKIRDAKGQVPPEFKILMNFIGIGDEPNPSLVQLSKESQDSTNNNLSPVYRDLTLKTISEALAKTKMKYDPDAFASTEKAPAELIAAFQQLKKNVPIFSYRVDPSRVQQLADQLGYNENIGSSLTNGAMVSSFLQFEKELQKFKKLPREVRLMFMQILLENFQRISSRPLGQLTILEFDALKRLVEWAQAYN